MQCFTSTAARDRFWDGVTIPDTPAESRAYQRKTVELARRCGEVSGELLDHITTADTARDLDALRHLVGDPALTYVGLSYGSMIGQTYANLFPGRVRAMLLDGIVDPVDQTTSMEANIGNAVYTVYVLSLPAGPIWLLHLVYTAVSAFMLLVHVCWTPRVLTTWNDRLPARLSRRDRVHAGATTPTLFLDLDVLEFGDQASAYAGAAHAAPATLTALR